MDRGIGILLRFYRDSIAIFTPPPGSAAPKSFAEVFEAFESSKAVAGGARAEMAQSGMKDLSCSRATYRFS